MVFVLIKSSFEGFSWKMFMCDYVCVCVCALVYPGGQPHAVLSDGKNVWEVFSGVRLSTGSNTQLHKGKNTQSDIHIRSWKKYCTVKKKRALYLNSF